MGYKVKFWNPGLNYLNIKPEIDAEIQRVLEAGDLILRNDVEKFEENVASFIGTEYAIGVNSGTTALYLALLASEIGSGYEVITASHTYISTISEIAHAGAKPVLVDIGDDGLIDVKLIRRAITPKTVAIIPVHLEGKVCDMEEIQEIAEVFGLTIIEDAAQAWGATDVGLNKKAGAIGDIGCFSCYPAKLFGAYGDAGVITTNKVEIAEEVKRLRFHYYIGGGYHGGDRGPEHLGVRYGYNAAISNLQAAILNVKFKYLDLYIQRRAEIAKIYDEGLTDLPIILPSKQVGRVYQDYVIRVPERKQELLEHLKYAGIEVLGYDLIPNHSYKALKLNYHLPKTEQYLKEQIRIPCNPELTNEEVEYVIETIRNFYRVPILWPHKMKITG